VELQDGDVNNITGFSKEDSASENEYEEPRLIRREVGDVWGFKLIQSSRTVGTAQEKYLWLTAFFLAGNKPGFVQTSEDFFVQKCAGA